MNVLLMGCGRTGANLAGTLDEQGHSVTILDIRSTAFRRLPHGYGGHRALGNGMDQAALESAGIEHTEVFVAVTQGDNRNFFASQLARVIYRVPRVICRTYDPVREEIFRNLGLETYSPTRLGTEHIVEMLGLDGEG